MASQHKSPTSAPPQVTGDVAGGDENETEEEFSSDEEVSDYAPGYEGLQKAYNDIQNILGQVATEYPQWFYEPEEGPGDQKVAPPVTESERAQADRDYKSVAEAEGDVAATGSGLVKEPEGGRSKTLPSGAGAAPTQLALPTTLKGGPIRSLMTFHSPDQIQQPSSNDAGVQSRPFSFSATQIRSLIHSETRHDDFAAEFIRTSGHDMNKTFVTQCTEEALKKLQQVEQDGVKTADQGQPSPIEKPKFEDYNTKGSSLKLIYAPPIWPHQDGLYKMLSRLPALRCLILDDSKLKWLRDLGSMLPNLKTLSVMRCGLKSLDGALGFSNLENVFAADNFITDPSPLATCIHLRFIDLSNNDIQNMDGFIFLKGLRVLTTMKLMENEVSKRPNFHDEMRSLIPNLRDLRPRILEIHGPDVFDLYQSPEDAQFSVPGTPGSALRSADTTQGLGGWVKEERRLLHAYNPGRMGYQKRAMSSIPYTVDEMDVLLEELESGSSEPSAVVSLATIDQYWQDTSSEGSVNSEHVQGDTSINQGRVSSVPLQSYSSGTFSSSIPPVADKRGKERAKTAGYFQK